MESKAVTRDLIAEKLCELTGLKKQESYNAVCEIVKFVTRELSTGREVSIRGFGGLKVVDRKARCRMNINTNEPIVVPAHKDISFKLYPELKEAINGNL